MPNSIIGNVELLRSVLKAAELLKTEEGNYIEVIIENAKVEGQQKAAGEIKPITKEALASKLVHPLDDAVCVILKPLLPSNGELDLYSHIDKVKELWDELVSRSIRCLRLLDTNEPYLYGNKEPIAYGRENLKRYFDKYADFESLLYGSNHSYRDHIVHVFQTWMLGILILFSKENQPSKDLFIKLIHAEGFRDKGKAHKVIPIYEALSMWTIIALCHDLGYPLQKANQILEATNKMMESFVYNPRTSLDIQFSGVQDSINDHILRFISSKMVEKKEFNEENKERFTGRVQPKYYIKFSKSLEQYSHGIVSSIILYKTLVYFLETDFNINEDYYYDEQKVTQYYWRREILRAIAAHTCDEIYHMHSTTLSFLLIVCDDLQEWGRKSWNEIYNGQKEESLIDTHLKKFNEEQVHIEETLKLPEDTKYVLKAIQKANWELEKYKRLFRDGQDTDNRSFDFIKDYKLRIGSKPKYIVRFVIPKEAPAEMRMRTEVDSSNIKDDTILNNLDIKFKVYDVDHDWIIITSLPKK